MGFMKTTFHPRSLGQERFYQRFNIMQQFCVLRIIDTSTVQLYNYYMNKKTVSKTNARDNFSDIYKQAKSGDIVYVADRGNAYVALVSVDKLKVDMKKPMKSYASSAFGMWKNKLNMEDKSSAEWVDEKRLERLKTIYGTVPSRYKLNS